MIKGLTNIDQREVLGHTHTVPGKVKRFKFGYNEQINEQGYSLRVSPILLILFSLVYYLTTSSYHTH